MKTKAILVLWLVLMVCFISASEAIEISGQFTEGNVSFVDDFVKGMPTSQPNNLTSQSTSPQLSYSQVIKTYPAGVRLCHTEANVTDTVMEDGKVLMLLYIPKGEGRVDIWNSELQVRCYGTKLTLDVPLYIEGKTFEKGAKLTVDKDLHFVQVSSWV